MISRKVLLPICALLASVALPVCRAHAEDLPSDVPAQIRATWIDVRRTWKPDAEFVALELERAAAGERFAADFVFKSNSDGRLHHVKSGPKGNSITTDVRQRFAWSLTSRVIDPAKAAAIARQRGMKGNVVTAVLQYWTDPRANGAAGDIPVGMGVEVWRLVPDNDPNTADPNDPNMKNYYVDAVGGTLYDPNHLPRDEFVKNAQAYQKALVQEMLELAGRSRP